MMVDKPSNSVFISNTISESQNAQEKSLLRLASGKRILAASDDAAGLAISMSIEAQSRELGRQMTNRLDEVSLFQTAEGALGGTTDAIQRISELSVQAANGTLTDSDRQNIQAEISSLTEHVNQIANNTEFNTKKLLDGTLKFSLQNGGVFSIPSMNAESLGLDTIDVSTQEGANSAIGAAGDALDSVVSQRATIGALTNGISSEISGLNNQFINSLESFSRISDADMAQEVMNLTSRQIQSQAAIKVFQIDNSQRGKILQLLA